MRQGQEDPVYFKRISELIEEAIAEHRAQRLSDLEFLNRVKQAREQVVRPKHEDVPKKLRKNEATVAFFRVLENELAPVSADHNGVQAIAADAAEQFLRIIEKHRVVNWGQREDVQNDMRNDLDDYLFDVVRDEEGFALAVNTIDVIVDRVMAVARVRLAA